MACYLLSVIFNYVFALLYINIFNFHVNFVVGFICVFCASLKSICFCLFYFVCIYFYAHFILLNCFHFFIVTFLMPLQGVLKHCYRRRCAWKSLW